MRKLPVILSVMCASLAFAGAVFVPGVDVTKHLDGTTRYQWSVESTPTVEAPKLGATPIVVAPEPERNCTRLEKRTCTSVCSGTGVIGCQVKTISGTLTEVCDCGDPGLFTRLRF
jgi:hypothetical protein